MGGDCFYSLSIPRAVARVNSLNVKRLSRARDDEHRGPDPASSGGGTGRGRDLQFLSVYLARAKGAEGLVSRLADHGADLTLSVVPT